MRDRMGWFLLAVGFLLVVLILGLPQSMFGAGPKNGSVRIDVSHATPRDVEDRTKEVVTRDYAEAWESLEQALETNRADALKANFVGFAHDEWAKTVQDQKTAGLNRRIIDHGHKLQVIFYSADGSAMQLRDTAQLEIQYRDGSKILHKENVSAHYLVLMTPAENSWKVRVLQEVAPGASQQSAALEVFPVLAGRK